MAGSAAAALLRKRAHEVEEADRKRRREATERDRLQAGALEDKKAAAARAKESMEQARLRAEQCFISNHREVEALRKQREVEKAFQRWLQTQFPADLFHRLRRHLQQMKPGARKDCGHRLGVAKNT